MEEDTDLILFCDFETTGKNPYSDEIIEGYFELHQDGELVDNYHFQSQTINWSHEAFLVHGITFEEMKTYPQKDHALEMLIDWLPLGHDVNFCCYANPNNIDGFYYFDYVILKMQMGYYDKRFLERPIFAGDKKLDVYNMAKECEKLGLYPAIINPQSGRKQFSQQKVYEALFEESYDAHRSYNDVKALTRIYYELTYLSLNGIVKRGQLKLL